MKMRWLDWLAMLLIIVGALNWGMVGLMDMNVVHMLTASMPGLERWVYILVGLSGVYSIYTAYKSAK